MSAIANALNITEEGYVLDARQGRRLSTEKATISLFSIAAGSYYSVYFSNDSLLSKNALMVCGHESNKEQRGVYIFRAQSTNMSSVVVVPASGISISSTGSNMGLKITNSHASGAVKVLIIYFSQFT